MKYLSVIAIFLIISNTIFGTTACDTSQRGDSADCPYFQCNSTTGVQGQIDRTITPTIARFFKDISGSNINQDSQCVKFCRLYYPTCQFWTRAQYDATNGNTISSFTSMPFLVIDFFPFHIIQVHAYYSEQVLVMPPSRSCQIRPFVSQLRQLLELQSMLPSQVGKFAVIPHRPLHHLPQLEWWVIPTTLELITLISTSPVCEIILVLSSEKL